MTTTDQHQQQIETMRHSTAHLLAAALLKLYPGAKLGVGPVVENGFYYDIDSQTPISVTDFAAIEKEMERIKKQNLPFVREELIIADARELMKDLKQDYKVQLLDDLERHGTTRINEQDTIGASGDGSDLVISIYRTGDFIDLCRGPHVASTQDIGAFKLKSVAGAYWRGDEHNPQLTRIYGYAFETKSELDSHLTMLEEAEKRDHRKLGRELELFTILDEVGSGLPLFYPKGALLRRLVENLISEEQEKRGYVPIWIPHITKGHLYEISGHLEKYDAMYPPMVVDDEDYYLKPMSCPHFMMLYKSLPHSYRDLPLRYTATTTVYRHEKSGELSGLTRVRTITQDDCHVYCTAEQIEDEIALMLDMIQEVYRIFGFKDYSVSISIRDLNNKEKYIGNDTYWETAELALQKAVAERNIPSIVCEGEAAFYGPKLDFIFKDALGRPWQLSTIQLDYNLPERFECEYMDSDGSKKRPIVIHRAILGSTERFLGIMIEHFAGRFPLWLAPVQVVVIPVGRAHQDACNTLVSRMRDMGMRCETDLSSETVGKKIRNAEKMKIPYIVVIGDKELNLTTLSIRKGGSKDLQTIETDAYIHALMEEIQKKIIQ